MLKRKRTGLIVWGAVLNRIGVLLVMWIVMNEDRYLNSIYSQNRAEGMFWILIGIMLAAGGMIMLIFGILNAVRVTRFNNKILAETNRLTYYATCFRCGYRISAKYTDFVPHSRYPNGFVYCPVCRTPCSINIFTAYKKDAGTLNAGR